MYRLVRLGCAMLITVALSATFISAKPFEPEFTITKIEGAVKVKAPGARRFSDAEAGTSYKYGTRVQTKRRSTAVIQFSQGNSCRIAAKSDVIIKADKANKNLKVMKLTVGKLDLSMDEMVEGHQLHIETAAAICGITGTKLHVESSRERNVNAVILQVKEIGSSVNLGNEIFEFKDVQGGEELGITVTDDRKYYRARVIKGDMQVNLLGDAGQESLQVQTGDLLKFFIRDYDDHSQITLMIYSSDDPNKKPRLVKTFRKKLPKKPKKPAPETTPPGPAGPDDPPPGQTTVPGDEEPPIIIPPPVDTTPRGLR